MIQLLFRVCVTPDSTKAKACRTEHPGCLHASSLISVSKSVFFFLCSVYGASRLRGVTGYIFWSEVQMKMCSTGSRRTTDSLNVTEQGRMRGREAGPCLRSWLAIVCIILSSSPFLYQLPECCTEEPYALDTLSESLL